MPESTRNSENSTPSRVESDGKPTQGPKGEQEMDKGDTKDGKHGGNQEGDGGRRPNRLMPSFLILWSGQALSLIGSGAAQFALVWWLTLETGSAAILATATLFALLPQVVMGPVIGALVDRWNRKAIMLVADGAIAVISIVMVYLFWSNLASVAMVLLLLFLRSIGAAFHGPAMTASTTLMVPKSHLARIQGLNQAVQGGLVIVAAPLGAYLLELVGIAGAMGVDVVTALFAIVPLLFIRVPQLEKSASSGDAGEKKERSGFLDEILDGLRYLRARRGHLALVGMASVINLCLVPAFALLPLLVMNQLQGNAMKLGWLTAGFGVGSLAGGIALGVWGGFKRKILTALLGIGGMGLATMVLGFAPPEPFALALGAVFMVGFMASMANGPILAVMQATIAPEFQGRVFTMMGSISGGMTPLGLILAAPVAEILGISAWYLVGGAVCTIMAIGAGMIRSIVHIEDEDVEKEVMEISSSLPASLPASRVVEGESV
jgi:DHA3 family macrolide efflux protein-like MFS transporter